MNYEGKSNRWIAIEVAKATGKRVSVATEFHDGDGILVYPHSNQINFNPCNNPSDAWKIIVSNEIGITPHGCWWMASNFNPSSVGDFQVQVMQYDKNPLRAAMICFLKMKESENG